VFERMPCSALQSALNTCCNYEVLTVWQIYILRNLTMTCIFKNKLTVHNTLNTFKSRKSCVQNFISPSDV
jgi:hypothetical protein